MKGIKYLITVLTAIVCFSAIAYGNPRSEYKTVYGKITRDNLTITSYSVNWTNTNLHTVYDELMKNTVSKELAYLSNIYIYPDTPYGMEGNYYEDILVNQKGEFKFGDSAYIEIFGAMQYSTAAEMAPVLSHEYGHHYTIVNIMNHENKLYTDWINSEYAKVRGFSAYPVVYSSNASQTGYHYKWDIAEIAANDYVQLLGSPNAKASYDYMDNQQIVDSKRVEKRSVPIHYNAKPQDNYELPLASDVSGLYEYMMKIGSVGGQAPSIQKRAAISSITESDAFVNKTYELNFTAAEGKGPFEYTVIMLSQNNKSTPEILKTVNDGEELKVTFGTVTALEGDKYIGVLDYYVGEYEIRIYAKDAQGFIYSSEPFYYDFGDTDFNLDDFLADVPKVQNNNAA